MYDHLFVDPAPGKDGEFLDSINPDSLQVLQGCKLEPSLAAWPTGDAVQFERLGYFAPDPDGTPEKPVFNRTMTLRDTWAKIQAQT